MVEVSRRHLLGAAGAVVAAGAVARAAPGAARAAEAGRLDADLREPLVVRVRDLRTGAMDVYFGDREVSVNDPQLAARLFRAAT